MIVFLCSAVLGQQPMFSKIISNPTGRNGYEEYVRAAEIASTPEFSEYLNLLPLWALADKAQIDWPQGVESSDPDLLVRRKWNDRFRDCLGLLEQGNRKSVVEPRDQIMPETIFPEMSQFRKLARLEANAAHVAFADGQSGVAVSHLEEAITFSTKLDTGVTLISRLVGVACGGIALAELDDHWAQLSINDAHELRGYLGGLLKAPNSLVNSMKGERQAEANAVGELFTNPKASSDGWLGSENLSKQILNLSAADAQQAQADTNSKIGEFYDSVDATLNGPESNWLNFKDPPDAGPKDSLGAKLADIVRPVIRQALIAHMRDRTRYRLAYLTATAIEYRWINGRLPDKIEQFTTKDERLDPSSGKSFVYAREGSWFKITREAKDDLGNVSIVSPHKADPNDGEVRA